MKCKVNFKGSLKGTLEIKLNGNVKREFKGTLQGNSKHGIPGTPMETVVRFRPMEMSILSFLYMSLFEFHLNSIVLILV